MRDKLPLAKDFAYITQKDLDNFCKSYITEQDCKNLDDYLLKKQRHGINETSINPCKRSIIHFFRKSEQLEKSLPNALQSAESLQAICNLIFQNFAYRTSQNICTYAKDFLLDKYPQCEDVIRRMDYSQERYFNTPQHHQKEKESETISLNSSIHEQSSTSQQLYTTSQTTANNPPVEIQSFSSDPTILKPQGSYLVTQLIAYEKKMSNQPNSASIRIGELSDQLFGKTPKQTYKQDQRALILGAMEYLGTREGEDIQKYSNDFLDILGNKFNIKENSTCDLEDFYIAFTLMDNRFDASSVANRAKPSTHELLSQLGEIPELKNVVMQAQSTLQKHDSKQNEIITIASDSESDEEKKEIETLQDDGVIRNEIGIITPVWANMLADKDFVKYTTRSGKEIQVSRADLVTALGDENALKEHMRKKIEIPITFQGKTPLKIAGYSPKIQRKDSLQSLTVSSLGSATSAGDLEAQKRQDNLTRNAILLTSAMGNSRDAAQTFLAGLDDDALNDLHAYYKKEQEIPHRDNILGIFSEILNNRNCSQETTEPSLLFQNDSASVSTNHSLKRNFASLGINENDFVNQYNGVRRSGTLEYDSDKTHIIHRFSEVNSYFPATHAVIPIENFLNSPMNDQDLIGQLIQERTSVSLKWKDDGRLSYTSHGCSNRAPAKPFSNALQDR